MYIKAEWKNHISDFQTYFIILIRFMDVFWSLYNLLMDFTSSSECKMINIVFVLHGAPSALQSFLNSVLVSLPLQSLLWAARAAALDHVN